MSNTPEANPTFVIPITASIAVPVAPTTCGVNAILSCDISCEHGMIVSLEQA